ncbi:MAG: FKBP-type peptidyl-prolyl cis-trans isomerase [Muribaculaceae bacterium]|nr:FKBP-type peptidyl-prolyl cis-trans isomerase [Muribaculaceae bacterium]
MKIQKFIIPAALSIILSAGLTSCLNDDDKNSFDMDAWINDNDAYFTRMQDTIDADGNKVYEKISPVWAPSVSILARWHNDRSLTASNLAPMDNSTVEIKYEGRYFNGSSFDSSYARKDSVYSCQPSSMIVGFWAMLTNMHVGDSVTCVIPYNAGYGTSGTTFMPYSTLVFDIKLKSIKAYEVPGK